MTPAAQLRVEECPRSKPERSSAATDRTIDQIGQRILTVFATMLSRIWGPVRGVYGAPRPRGDRGLTFALSTVVCYRTARYIALCGGQWRWFAVSKFGYSAVFLAGWLSAYCLTTIEAGP